jgi:transposase InsO family protein
MKKHLNLLKGKIPSKPEEVFVSDITYVESLEGMNYMSLVTGAFSRKTVDYHLSHDMKSVNVVKALTMTARDRRYSHEVIHRWDSGSQHCSKLYQCALQENNMVPSMTDGYDCYQNALAERVNGTLKQEFLLYECKTINELSHLVSESVHIYNGMRLHLSLDMNTPNNVHIIESQ